MLNYFLLFSFLVSFIPLAYILGDMNPSNSCGPFKASSEEHFYTGLVYGLISVSNTWRLCSFLELVVNTIISKTE